MAICITLYINKSVKKPGMWMAKASSELSYSLHLKYHLLQAGAGRKMQQQFSPPPFAEYQFHKHKDKTPTR